LSGKSSFLRKIIYICQVLTTTITLWNCRTNLLFSMVAGSYVQLASDETILL